MKKTWRNIRKVSTVSWSVVAEKILFNEPVNFKAEFILERKHFFIALSHAHFHFLRSRASLIDRYQIATSKAISLHELKKSTTSRAIRARDTGFYWSSENALHERFIASSGVGVWMKTLQLIAKRLKKTTSVQVWIQLKS